MPRRTTTATHPARYKRRPTQAEVQAVLEAARELRPRILALGDYDRSAKWADLNDKFSPFAHSALKVFDGVIYWLAQALREARE